MKLHETDKRKLIFLLVFLSHCSLIYVIERSVRTHRSSTPIPREALVVFFIHNEKEKQDSRAVADPTSEKAHAATKHPSFVPATPLPQDISPDAASSNAITDWNSTAPRVAEDTVEREMEQASKRASSTNSHQPRPRSRPSLTRCRRVVRAHGMVPTAFMSLTIVTMNTIKRRDLRPRLSTIASRHRLASLRPKAAAMRCSRISLRII